jgi:hypothetical protein
MAFVTKAQALALKRRTQELKLPELDSPLLVAEMSGRAALRLQKVGADTEERLILMVADMVVNEDGSRMFTADEVPGFLERISIDSATNLLKACTVMRAPSEVGDPGNSRPSTTGA